MKQRRAWVIAIILCLLAMTACSGAAEKGEVLLKDDTVRKISVTSVSEGYAYSFTGDSAQAVIDYISKLHLRSRFAEDPDVYSGMTWVISLEYDGGEIHTIYHFGNMFIRVDDHAWYKMTYEEAGRFEALLEELPH